MTLTDRYIDQVVRALPRRQRADIEAELRGIIADGIDDRMDRGMDVAAAEHDVIAALGAPGRLAASYADRGLFLVGPDLYLDYLRVLAVVLSTVVPLWFLFLGVTSLVSGATVIGAIGAALFGAAQTAMVIAFVITVVFVIIERSPRMRARHTATWNPSSLRDVISKRGYWGELVGGSIFFVLIAAGLIIAQTVGAVPGADGARVGPIAPDLWASGLLAIALLFAIVSISFHVSTYYTGPSISTAIATTILGVLFVVPSVWLAASGRLLDPRFFEAVGWAGGAQILATVVVVAVIVLALMDSVDAWTKALRGRRTAT